MSLTDGLVAAFTINARVGRGERFEMNVLNHIIVGAGSAGCLLANRLSQTGDRSVLVLEAGPMDRKLAIHIPAGVSKAYLNLGINRNYEAALHARRVFRAGVRRGRELLAQLAFDALRGIETLRVVHASIMPRVASANLKAPTLMIAARAAGFILGRQQKEPQTVPLHFREKSPCAYQTI